MRKLAALLGMLSLIVLTIAAPTFAQDTNTLTGTQWQLVSIAGEPVAGETVITLEFVNDEQAGGLGGCNSYSATYTLDGTNITFSPIGSTLMACETDVMDSELRYFTALEGTNSYEITDEQLIIYGDGEELVYEPLAKLEGSTWQLLTYNDRDVLEDTVITLEFGEDGQFSGSGGCNTYNGTYTLDGDTITIDRIRSTRMACADEAKNSQEQNFFTALQAALTYALDGDQLTITGADEGILVFARVQPLVNTSWQLVSIAGTEVAAGSGVTLEFDNVNRIAGSGGCNEYSGDYSLDGDAITLSEIISTKRACTDSPMMQQETDFFNALEAATSYELSEDQLIITYGDGQELVFVSTTPVARA